MNKHKISNTVFLQHSVILVVWSRHRNGIETFMLENKLGALYFTHFISNFFSLQKALYFTGLEILYIFKCTNYRKSRDKVVRQLF